MSVGEALHRRISRPGADIAERWLGNMLVLASAVAFSTAGFFTRLIELDVWTILFWRCLFGGLFIAGLILVREGRGFLAACLATGRAGLAITACSGAATICFINALRLTSVADVTVIFATAPFVAAALAWLWLGQRARPSTLIASLVALAGVAVMLGGDLSFDQVAGNLLALAMTLLMSLVMVIIRARREVSMPPAMGLSAFVAALVAVPFAAPLSPGPLDMLWLVLFGGLQFGLGMLLMSIGTRYISAARSALIGNLELPMAPLWVWLAFAEVPSLGTAIGGGIVLAAVLADTVLDRG
jgi:drug/metabolite transporter (DMT)-like permease